MGRLIFLAISVTLACGAALAADPTSQPATATAPATTSATSQPATGPTSRVVMDQSSIKSLLESMHNAAMAADIDALTSCISPTFRTRLRSMAELARDLQIRTSLLRKDMVEKFGQKDTDELLGRYLRLPGMRDVSPLRAAVKDGQIDWSLVAIKQEGDSATVTIASRGLQKVGNIQGKWYMTPAGTITPDQAQMMAEQYAAIRQATLEGLDEIAQGVRRGTITKESFPQATEVLHGRIAKAEQGSRQVGAASAPATTAPAK